MMYHYSILGSLRAVRSELKITDLDVVMAKFGVAKFLMLTGSFMKLSEVCV